MESVHATESSKLLPQKLFVSKKWNICLKMWNISQSPDQPWHPTGPIQLGSRAGRECCKLWLVILRWIGSSYIHACAYGQYQLAISGLILTLHLTRNSGFHLLQTYLPSFIFVLLGWLGLFIPRTSVPGRVGMGMTTILTLTAMLRLRKHFADSFGWFFGEYQKGLLSPNLEKIFCAHRDTMKI